MNTTICHRKSLAGAALGHWLSALAQKAAGQRSENRQNEHRSHEPQTRERNSREKAPEAQKKRKERGQPCPPLGCGRLVRIVAPTFVSASRMRSSSSASFYLSHRSKRTWPPACPQADRSPLPPHHFIAPPFSASFACLPCFLPFLPSGTGRRVWRATSFRQNIRKVLAKGKTGVRFE